MFPAVRVKRPVARSTRAWIETAGRLSVLAFTAVARSTRAWIETEIVNRGRALIGSHALRVRGLKRTF